MSRSHADNQNAQDGDAVQLRPIRLDDFPALADMHDAAFARGWDVAALGELAASFGVFGLVLIGPDEPQVCGFILGRIVAGEGEILTIVVAPDERKKGIGAALLEGALKEFSEGGATEIFLEVAEENIAAIRLYQKYGFVQIGRRRNYATVAPDTGKELRKNKRQDALQMRLNLV